MFGVNGYSFSQVSEASGRWRGRFVFCGVESHLELNNVVERIFQGNAISLLLSGFAEAVNYVFQSRPAGLASLTLSLFIGPLAISIMSIQANLSTKINVDIQKNVMVRIFINSEARFAIAT
jgi:hypothetical protein